MDKSSKAAAKTKAETPKATKDAKTAKDTKATPAKSKDAKATAKDTKATAKDSKATPAKDTKATAAKSPTAKDAKAAKDTKATPAKSKDTKAAAPATKAASPKAASSKPANDVKDSSPKAAASKESAPKADTTPKTKEVPKDATKDAHKTSDSPKASSAKPVGEASGGAAVIVAARGARASSSSSSSSSDAKKKRSGEIVVFPSAIKRFESDNSLGKNSMDKHSTQYHSVKITVIRAKGLVKLNTKKRQAPYVVLQLGDFKITGRICSRRSRDPYFAEQFHLPWSTGQNLKLTIRNREKDRSDRNIAAAKLNIVEVSELSSKTLHLALTGPNGVAGGVVVINVAASSTVVAAPKVERVPRDVSSSASSLSNDSSKFSWVTKTKGKILVNGTVHNLSDASSASTHNRNKKKGGVLVITTATHATTTTHTATAVAAVSKKSTKNKRSGSVSRSSSSRSTSSRGKRVKKAVATVVGKDGRADNKKETSTSAVVVTSTTNTTTSSAVVIGTTHSQQNHTAVVSATKPVAVRAKESSSSSSSSSSFSVGNLDYSKTHSGLNISVMNCVYGAGVKKRGSLFVRVKMGVHNLDGRGVSMDPSFNTFFGDSFSFVWNTEARLKVVLYERQNTKTLAIGSGVLNLDKIYRNPGDLKLSLVSKKSEVGHLNMNVSFVEDAPATNHTAKVSSYSMLSLPASLEIGGGRSSPRPVYLKPEKKEVDGRSFQSSTSSSVFRDNALAGASTPYKAIKVLIFSGNELMHSSDSQQVHEAVCTLSVGGKKVHCKPVSGNSSHLEFNMEALLPYRGERFIKCVVKDSQSKNGLCAKGRLDLDPYLIKKVGLKKFSPKIDLLGRHGKSAGYLDMMVQFSDDLVKEALLTATAERYTSKESLSSAGSSTKSSEFEIDGTAVGLRISVLSGEKLHVSKRADLYFKAGTEKKRVRSHVLEGEGKHLSSQVTFFLPYRSAKYATLQLYEKETAAPDLRVGAVRINLGPVRSASKRVHAETISFEDRNGIARGTAQIETAILSEAILKPSVTLMTSKVAKAESASSSASH